MIFDLNGDGIETADVYEGDTETAYTYFDHNGDGRAELSNWAGPEDGFLVMDRNRDGIINDGRELFGDQTILKNGQKASNGFEALAALDSNNDGKIDASDEAYSQLRIWKDINGDGYSLASELHTLDELGIKSINLNSAPDSTTDPQGNTRPGSVVFSELMVRPHKLRNTIFSAIHSRALPPNGLMCRKI